MAVRLTPTAIAKGIKKCRVCKRTKPITEFVHDLTSKWMPNDCRECERKRYHVRNNRPARRNRVHFNGFKSNKPESCEVCKSRGQICYDHCHITDLHRGWLCQKCNSILGFAEEDPERLHALAEYLETFFNSEAVRRYLETEEEDKKTYYLPI